MSVPSENRMDLINSFLGRLILEDITPVVMVLTTPLVENTCRKNGLNFVEMLLPFSLFKNIDVPVRTASDQPYRLQMFKLRLIYSSDIKQQNYEAAEAHLKKVVCDASEKILPELLSDLPQLESVLNKSESHICPSWIQTFNKELIQTLSFSDHETFDHPVACLLVVSSKDEQPVSRFVDLFNTDHLPSLLNDGAMDPKILKHYVLLHDYQDGTPEKAASILAEMRTTFGSNNCRLLCINSAQDVNDDCRDIPWVSYRTRASLGHDVASFLNINDLNGIKEFMLSLSSSHIIPHMEQKIRILNQQIAATRKGFRNQIRNLWWRKGKEDAPEAPSGSMYTFSSIESQIRVLGDYAFMLRDYELALSNYRLLSTDYKLDKAWKHYAGVQEMSGLCYFMLDQSRKESEYCMENAFNTYLKIGSSGQRNATRCGLWWAEMLKARGQYREAASIYSRISAEEPSLHAAVMLEQASYCFLFAKPPMLRKYGFHLILTGNRYYISEQRHHAIRAYRNALFVYEGNAWSYITDHVHFNIGRWYAFLGIFDVAIKHMLKVLACSHQSVTTQNIFLSDFFHIVQSVGKTFEVYKLQLPVIDMSSLKIIYEDQRTYASSADVLVSESLWKSLEEDMIPSTNAVKSNWLDSHPKFSPLKKNNDSCVCIAGESIRLELEFKNPLQISISVSNISLMCEHSSRSEETSADVSESATTLHDDTGLRTSPSCRHPINDDSSFSLSKHDFVLRGGETIRVQLKVSPVVEGILKIVGVRWTLSDAVVGYQYFELDAKKKHKKGRRGQTHSLRSNLNFVVIKGLPKLEGCIRHLPHKFFAGDMRLLTLELRNQSEFSVKNIKMKVSHPRFLIPGSSGDQNLDFPQCLEKQISSSTKVFPAHTLEKAKSLLFSFPLDTTIEGGATLKWPLWFHAGLHGNVSIYLSIYYEVKNCSSDMTYRTLRMHYDLEVLPSLDVSFHITPSPSRLQEYLVRMDIVNNTSSETFNLHQLSCVSDQWEVSTLPGYASICPMQIVLASQALSCFFKLKDCRKSPIKESDLIAHGNDVLLDPQGSNASLIDVSQSPLADFHHHERYHQGKSAQGCPGIVDFILFSRTQESISDHVQGLPLQLLSSHVCHCSVASSSPVWWQMDGPRLINHDFSTSFCEASLRVMIHNCSKVVVSVRLSTFDTLSDINQLSDAVQVPDSLENQGGWHEISVANDIKVISSVQGNRSRKGLLQSSPPFLWSTSSSTQHELEPARTVVVPLRITIFTPGTYDLSSYELHWKLQPSEQGLAGDVRRWSPGKSRGHPFFLTVLQSSHGNTRVDA